MPGRLGLTADNTSMRISEGLEKPGTVKAWGTATLPNGWLELTGQIVSQASWPNLFAIYGTTYNTGSEGAGNFRLPNAVGSTLVGAGTYIDPVIGSTTRSIATGFIGAASHVLTQNELASHNHSVFDSGHSHTVSPTLYIPGSSEGGHNVPALGSNFDNGPFVTTPVSAAINESTIGANFAHTNMQPSFVQKWIVKG